MLFHPLIKPPDYAVAVARAYNAWLVDVWLGKDRGVPRAVLAPHHDPIAAAEEIGVMPATRRSAASSSRAAASTRSTGTGATTPCSTQPRNAVSLSSSTPSPPSTPCSRSTCRGSRRLHGACRVAHVASVANAMRCSRQACRSASRSSGSRSPRGIGWVPWLGMKLDKEYGERRREVPFLTERPSHYLQRMFFATQPIEEPEHLGDMATLYGLFDGENNGLCVGLASPRFRPSGQGAADSRFRRAQAEDHGRECGAASSVSTSRRDEDRAHGLSGRRDPAGQS